MILAGGQVYDTAEQDRLLDSLEGEITAVLSGKPLCREQVISALDKMSSRLLAGEYSRLTDLAEVSGEQVRTAALMMSRQAAEFRIRQELGKTEYTFSPPGNMGQVTSKLCPLGVLFHIAAGNASGLPVLSVMEGLITGNVNILKLPRADSGLTVEIFRQLTDEYPELSGYIYIFDTPSADARAMEKMASYADGIVIWGGDEAVRAVRNLAMPGTRLIEWGHKLGFAYVSGFEDRERELAALACHIISTGQRLCSSCQTIYINTRDRTETEDFCREFLPYLDRAAEENADMGTAAVRTLERYAGELEDIIGCGRENIVRGKYFRLKMPADSSLQLSPPGCCYVKSLPEEDIIRTLRPSKGYLQTAGLICSKDSRSRLTGLLLRAGVCRVMRAGNMSADIIGGCHDGEYGLRRLVRAADIEE